MKKLMVLIVLGLAVAAVAGQIKNHYTTVTVPVSVDSVTDTVYVMSLEHARGVVGEVTVSPANDVASIADSTWGYLDSGRIVFRSSIGSKTYTLDSLIFAIPGTAVLNCLDDSLLGEKLYYKYTIHDSAAVSDTNSVLPKYKFEAVFKTFKD
ncbi:MAG: hypothetical protein P1R58_10930 [bacterium]|nr:hypothetical protein [bacterium]